MRPMEAYESVMRFAAERGEPALRLAFHAAVPQSFRPDLLHLLRLNFVPEASHEAESDVLLAPFCEDAGGAYYQFDPEARRLLLDNLDPTYFEEQGHRVRRVADFLATYIENRSRSLSEEQDRLSRDFLSIQGWVALAFRDPEIAAVQLAAALDQGTREDFAARVQFSGLASALSVPLVQYPKLLTYAAGLEALEQGRTDDAVDLLERLPDEEIQIGGVKLRSPRRFLMQKGAPEKVEKAAPRTTYKKCFIAYSEKDRQLVERLRQDLRGYGVPLWFGPEELRVGAHLEASIRDSILLSDVLLLMLTDSAQESRWVRFEVEAAMKHSIPIIAFIVDEWRWEDAGWLSSLQNRFDHLLDAGSWAKRPGAYEEALTFILRYLWVDAAPTENTEPEIAPEVSGDLASSGWDVLKRAGFEYQCYISWDDRSSGETRRRVERFVEMLNVSLDEHFGQPKIFFKKEASWYRRIFGSLDEALHRSAAMVALYTPGYADPRARGGREWAAMERLRHKRIPGEPFGLIVPVVLQRAQTLPRQFRQIHFIDLSVETSVYDFLANQAREDVSQRIADIVAALVRHEAKVEPRRFELPKRSAFEEVSPKSPLQKYDVFLSYSRQDSHIAEQIANGLAEAGIRTWVDSYHLPPGTSLDYEIKRQIDRSSLVVALLSQSSLASEFWRQELSYAIEVHSKRPSRVLIVEVGEVDIRMAIPFLFHQVQRLKWLDDNSLPYLVSFVDDRLSGEGST